MNIKKNTFEQEYNHKPWLENLKNIIYDDEFKKDSSLLISDINILDSNLENKILSFDQVLDYHVIDELFFTNEIIESDNWQLEEYIESIVNNQSRFSFLYYSPDFIYMISSESSTTIDASFQFGGSIEKKLKITSGQNQGITENSARENEDTFEAQGNLIIKGGIIIEESSEEEIKIPHQEITIRKISGFKVTNLLFKCNKKINGFFLFDVPKNFNIKYSLKKQEKIKNIYSIFEDNQFLGKVHENWVFKDEKLYFKLFFTTNRNIYKLNVKTEKNTLSE